MIDMPEKTTDLALRTGDFDGPRAILPRSFSEAKDMAEYLGKSGLLPAAINKGPAAVYAIIAAGAELRLPPMAALRSFFIFNGTPRLWAEAQAAIVVSRTDLCEYLYPVEQTATRCTWATRRRGHPAETRVSWDIERARRAKLDTKDTWKAYPERMLSARAKSDLLRDIYPDLIGGLATEYDDSPDVEPVEVFTRPPAREIPPATPASLEAAAAVIAERKARKAKEPPTQRTDATGLVVPIGPATDDELDRKLEAKKVAEVAAFDARQAIPVVPEPETVPLRVEKPGPAPAAVSDYEASAARVEAAARAADQAAAADERAPAEWDEEDEPAPAGPPQLVAFRAALAAVAGGREPHLIDADLARLRATFTPLVRGPSRDGKIPAGALHAHAAEFKAAFMDRCAQLGVSGTPAPTQAAAK